MVSQAHPGLLPAQLLRMGIIYNSNTETQRQNASFVNRTYPFHGKNGSADLDEKGRGTYAKQIRR